MRRKQRLIRSQLHFRRVLCATYKCLLQEVSWAKPPEHVKTVANNTTNPAINGFEENGTGVYAKNEIASICLRAPIKTKLNRGLLYFLPRRFELPFLDPR